MEKQPLLIKFQQGSLIKGVIFIDYFYCRNEHLHEKLDKIIFSEMIAENVSSKILNVKIVYSDVIKVWKLGRGEAMSAEDIEQLKRFRRNVGPVYDREGEVGILIMFELKEYNISIIWELREYMKLRCGWGHVFDEWDTPWVRAFFDVDGHLRPPKDDAQIVFTIDDNGNKAMRPLLENFIKFVYPYKRKKHKMIHPLCPELLKTITIPIVLWSFS